MAKRRSGRAPVGRQSASGAPRPSERRGAFSLADNEIEQALVTGEYRGELEDYFGAAQYEQLRRLKQEASSRSVRGGDRVLILPGITGSKLGRKGPILDDVIWVDPLDLALGRLEELRLPQQGKSIVPLGVILFAYLSLKLRLQLSGFDADFWPYDWRVTIPTLGRQLAAQVLKERDEHGTRPVYVVAHSMGGLVTRASLAQLTKPQAPDRIVMLGTPNYGSFAPVQAFRGASGTVQKLAVLDQKHDAAELAGIFGTFPGLLEMIPSAKFAKRDFFDLSVWPQTGVRPDQRMLAAAKKAQDSLPLEHPEIVMVCGVNRDTVVDAQVQNGEFVYTVSREGDGTVPLDCARIPTAKSTYYVEEEHGALPGNGQIQKALPSLLTTGRTSDLADTHTPARGGPVRSVTERQLAQQAPSPALGLPSVREQRLMLSEFVAPQETLGGLTPLTSAAITTASPLSGTAARSLFSQRVVVGRGRQQRLDITLARGSITEADASCYVVGLFQNVAADGAALAIDADMGGALTDLISRRMFGADVGEISILPRGRHALRAGSVAFAGLGAFDKFSESSLEIVGENLVRTFAAARVDDFATVPLGGGAGRMTLQALQYLMVGFLRGLKDADHDRRFRGITICETNEDRYTAIRDELFRLSATPLFDHVEVEFQECVLPERRVATDVRGPSASPKTYLIIRQDRDRQDLEGFVSSVLTSGSGAAIESGRKSVEERQPSHGVVNRLDKHLEKLSGVSGMSSAQLGDFGRDLGEIVLADNVRDVLKRYAEDHLVVIHDAAASRVPWETLVLGDPAGDQIPATQAGLSHRYEAANFSVAKWRRARQLNDTLSVLLIVDPTSDLQGARDEGVRIEKILKALQPAVRYRRLYQDEALKSEVLRCFSSGEFDVVHYAGHAFFDPEVRGNSGLLCARREVLSGADLANVGDLPSLMFFNACESARVRRDNGNNIDAQSPEQVRRNVSFAEALLRGGIANFLGTYWPVGDDAAKAFAGKFYETLLTGEPLNAAVLKGRANIVEKGSPDWADYVFYGDPEFRVKMRA